MRLIFYSLMLLVASCPVFAQDSASINNNSDQLKIVSPFKKFKEVPKLRFGLTVSPLLTWAHLQSDEISRGKLRGGVEYGGLVEYFFTANVGLSSGVIVQYNGANLVYLDSAAIKTFNSERPTSALFKFQYLTIPMSVKVKSNQIGVCTYYAELGFLLGFCIDAHVAAQEDDSVIYDNANFLTRKNNQTDDHLLSTLVNFSLHGGGGVEYAINSRISLITGITYNNGFVKVVQDISGRSITLNNVVFKVGILF